MATLVSGCAIAPAVDKNTISIAMEPESLPIGIAADEIDPGLVVALENPGGEDTTDKHVAVSRPHEPRHAISYLEEMGHFQ